MEQWGGYYAPQIFANIGCTGAQNSLLASGVHGVVKAVATSSPSTRSGIGIFFFIIIGALLKQFPLPLLLFPEEGRGRVANPDPPPASKVIIPGAKAARSLEDTDIILWSTTQEAGRTDGCAGDGARPRSHPGPRREEPSDTPSPLSDTESGSVRNINQQRALGGFPMPVRAR
ncbi:hypothetical protein B0H12DRAFT_1242269 [Mycena haematopus]|nr:hypothetical protein B0H12DRAFT_1242269 [Mycena haematopus]